MTDWSTPERVVLLLVVMFSERSNVVGSTFAVTMAGSVDTVSTHVVITRPLPSPWQVVLTLCQHHVVTISTPHVDTMPTPY